MTRVRPRRRAARTRRSGPRGCRRSPAPVSAGPRSRGASRTPARRRLSCLLLGSGVSGHDPPAGRAPPRGIWGRSGGSKVPQTTRDGGYLGDADRRRLAAEAKRRKWTWPPRRANTADAGVISRLPRWSQKLENVWVNTRRLVSWILLACAVGVSLAACSSGAVHSSTPTTAPSSAAAAPSASSTPRPRQPAAEGRRSRRTGRPSSTRRPRSRSGSACCRTGQQFASVIRAQAARRPCVRGHRQGHARSR